LEASLFPLGDDGSGDEDLDALLSVSLLLAFCTDGIISYSFSYSIPALRPLSSEAFSTVAEEFTTAPVLSSVVFLKLNGRCACESGTPGVPCTASGANEGG